MSIKLTILEQMTEVAHAQGKILPPLHDDLELRDSGFDSLLMAMLLVRLEDRLGIAPFSGTGDVELPVTVGDFIKVYENGGLLRPASDADMPKAVDQNS
jgi:acyl carrier protein